MNIYGLGPEDVKEWLSSFGTKVFESAVRAYGVRDLNRTEEDQITALNSHFDNKPNANLDPTSWKITEKIFPWFTNRIIASHFVDINPNAPWLYGIGTVATKTVTKVGLSAKSREALARFAEERPREMEGGKVLRALLPEILDGMRVGAEEWAKDGLEYYLSNVEIEHALANRVSKDVPKFSRKDVKAWIESTWTQSSYGVIDHPGIIPPIDVDYAHARRINENPQSLSPWRENGTEETAASQLVTQFMNWAGKSHISPGTEYSRGWRTSIAWRTAEVAKKLGLTEASRIHLADIIESRKSTNKYELYFRPEVVAGLRMGGSTGPSESAP